MYRNRRFAVLPIVGLVTAALIISFVFSVFSPSQQAKRVVDEFYTYEQEGNFGDSWELLHPLMKAKWPKTAYITDRSHVFMGHFGAETFEYSIEDSEVVKGWRMAKDTPNIKKVYKFVVVQDYKGKYGTFAFVQEVFVARDSEGEYVILWDYKN